jgi:hypothetical protein
MLARVIAPCNFTIGLESCWIAVNLLTSWGQFSQVLDTTHVELVCWIGELFSHATLIGTRPVDQV